jgi:small nuclear ribonucleoprotein D3
VPIKLLHEGEGHVVTVELKNGEIYRGMLSEAEDTMNCQMKEGNLHKRQFFLLKLKLICSHWRKSDNDRSRWKDY